MKKKMIICIVFGALCISSLVITILNILNSKLDLIVINITAILCTGYTAILQMMDLIELKIKNEIKKETIKSTEEIHKDTDPIKIKDNKIYSVYDYKLLNDPAILMNLKANTCDVIDEFENIKILSEVDKIYAYIKLDVFDIEEQAYILARLMAYDFDNSFAKILIKHRHDMKKLKNVILIEMEDMPITIYKI